jgi:hypothetical protein
MKTWGNAAVSPLVSGKKRFRKETFQERNVSGKKLTVSSAGPRRGGGRGKTVR